MSGGEVSYNLRPNKFVERQLFVELLGKICAGHPSEKFAYISLGGQQLEDQRLVHRRLGIETLISLEDDPIVLKRQIFNLRPSYIQCTQGKTADFVSNFDNFADTYNDKEFIIWFDYASARERREQIIEYQTLLSKLQPLDIFKITMNANPRTLGEQRSDESNENVQKRRLDALSRQLDSFLPAIPIHYAEMTKQKFVPILCHAIKKASLNAMQNTRMQVVPLSIFVYQDGPHQMLTITVRLMRSADRERLQNNLVELGWEYLPSDWNDFTRINVPNLTAKERLYLERLLFSKAHEEIHEELPFRFHSNQQKSLGIFEEYARHYNRYPSYFQVVL